MAITTDRGVVRLGIDAATLTAAARRAAGREKPTADEWKQYIGGTRHALREPTGLGQQAVSPTCTAPTAGR